MAADLWNLIYDGKLSNLIKRVGHHFSRTFECFSSQRVVIISEKKPHKAKQGKSP